MAVEQKGLGRWVKSVDFHSSMMIRDGHDDDVHGGGGGDGGDDDDDDCGGLDDEVSCGRLGGYDEP